MTPWRDALREFIRREALPVDKYGHQPRLYELTRHVGAGFDYDDDVVYAAAWLHDLGVFTGHRPEDLGALAAWDNTAYAMGETPAILQGLGFPAGKIAAVVEAIRTHQPSADPASLEAIILRDADILEQLGAVGVLRATCKVGRDTRFPTLTSVVDTLRRALDTLPPRIRLDTTRTLAEPKIQLLQAFLAAASQEGSPELY